ncbi:MAG: M1 family aminopeptidase [Bacteroidia bacterium]|nr:M1 family aminopeptidase [Bacteroidia bacterium]
MFRNIRIILVAALLFCTSAIFAGNHNQLKYLHSDSLDVINYYINLNITDFTSHVIKGFTTLMIVPKINNLNIVNLDLLMLTVDSVHYNNNPVPGFTYSDSLVHVPIIPAASTTDTMVITVFYHGTPHIAVQGWGGFYFSSSAAFNIGMDFYGSPHNFGKVWFPCVDDFIDRAIYDYKITVPTGKKAICEGKLIDSTYNSDSTMITYHWHMSQKIPAYLASVAIDNYSVITSSYIGIQDTIPVTIFVEPADSLNAVHSFTNLESAFHIFESKFGRYRWPRIGYSIVPFNGGAMENPTNIAYPKINVDGTLLNESMIVHELSHSWFGDQVTCHSDSDMWLNEGWAGYCEYLFREFHYGSIPAAKQRMVLHCENLRYLHIKDGGFLPLYGLPDSMTYCSTIYDKGADVVHTLRKYLSDTVFFAVIKGYLNSFAFKDATTEQLKNFLTTHTGTNMDDFFQTWVYSGGWPHFSIDSFTVIPSGTDYNVTVYIRQRLRGLSQFANSNRIPVTFIDQNQNTSTKLAQFSGEFGILTTTISFNPACAILDYNSGVMDAKTSCNNKVTALGTVNFPSTYFTAVVTDATDSGFVRIEHNWVPPDSLKVPNPQLTLSHVRYWKVDGIIPDSLIMNGKFAYSKATSGTNGLLDIDLLNDSITVDSLVLLYRKNTSYDWKLIPSALEGTSISGNLAIDTLKTGEYCLAARNRNILHVDENIPQSSLRVFPNPSGSDVTIEYLGNNKASIKICQIDGKEILNYQFPVYQHSFKWKTNGYKKGSYIIRLFEDGKISHAEKLILN